MTMTRGRSRLYANTRQRKTAPRHHVQDHAKQPSADEAKPSEEAPDASTAVLPKEFAGCGFCGKPTKISARPGVPVYHAVCAAEAGIDHGPERGGKR